MSKGIKQHEVYWKIRNQDAAKKKTYTHRIEWMDRKLPIEEPFDNILDAGCGEALFTPHLARRAKHIRACDISTSQIATNCDVHPGMNFFVQNLANPIAAEAKSFDVIWCSDTLSQIINPTFTLREFHRVLKPSGQLLITVPFHGLFKNLKVALFHWEQHFDVENPNIRFFTIKTLTRLVKRVGFREILTESSGDDILLSAKK